MYHRFIAFLLPLSLLYGASSPCDLNADGQVNVVDVQIATNQALGIEPCVDADLYRDGQCNVVDVQRFVNAALGQECQSFTLGQSSLPAGLTGTPYSTALFAKGGTEPYAWRISAGFLPLGLIMDSAGLISGTPTFSEQATFTATVVDSSILQQTATSTFTISVQDSGPIRDAIWSADFELGDTSQWYAPSTGPFGYYGGGEYNTGTASSAVTQTHAHSGSRSLAMSTTTPSTPESGTRMFRWLEPQTHPELYYSVWYYFPQTYSIPNWWNVFQWKSRISATGANDPFFILNVGNRPDGSMYLYLFDWQKRVTYSQTLKNIPVGHWFRVQALYRCAGNGTGQVTFWQDDTQILDVPNVQTRYSNGDCQWSINNYSDKLTPSPATIFIDDAAISTSR